MLYNSTQELLDSVRDNLSKHAQDIYKEAFNSACEQYKDPEDRRDNSSREETAHKVARSAVKNEYEKNEKTGKWQKA